MAIPKTKDQGWRTASDILTSTLLLQVRLGPDSECLGITGWIRFLLLTRQYQILKSGKLRASRMTQTRRVNVVQFSQQTDISSQWMRVSSTHSLHQCWRAPSNKWTALQQEHAHSPTPPTAVYI